MPSSHLSSTTRLPVQPVLMHRQPVDPDTDPAMRSEWTPLDSSNVAACAYDPDKQELYVRFRSGATYAYHGAEQSLHDDLVASSSPGSFVRGPLAAYDYSRTA